MGLNYIDIGKGIDYTEFTDQQILAIQILAQKEMTGKNYSDIAKEVGVNTKTLWSWRRDSKFQQAIANTALSQIVEGMPKVYNATLKKASQGSARHTEILLRIIGQFSDKSEIEFTDKTEPKENNEELKQRIEEMKKVLGKDKPLKRIK